PPTSPRSRGPFQSLLISLHERAAACCVRNSWVHQSDNAVMIGPLKAWAMWTVTFLCACSVSVPLLPVQKLEVLGTEPAGLVIRPRGYQPVQLTAEELQQGMRMLYANGPLPGAPKVGRLRLILTSTDPSQMLKAAGYLQFCQHLTGQRTDCWDELNAS